MAQEFFVTVRAVFTLTFLLMLISPVRAFDTSLALPENMEVVSEPKPGSTTVVRHTFSWQLPSDASLHMSEKKYLLLFERKLPTDTQFKQFATTPVSKLTLMVAVNASKHYAYRVRAFLGARVKSDWRYSPYSAELQPSGSGLPGPTPPYAWQHRFGSFAAGKAVTTDINGGLLLGGLTYDPLFFTVAGQSKAIPPGSFVTKYSLTGTVLWVNALGSDAPADPDIRVATDPWGDVVVAVEFSGNGHFDGAANQAAQRQDIMLVKYQGSDGRHLWHRKIGGNGNDGGHALLVDQEGNIYVGGYFDAPSAPCMGQGVDFGAGEVCGGGAGRGRAFLAKYSSEGNLLWLNTSLGAAVFDLAVDGANNLIASSVTGNAYTDCSRELHGSTLGLTRVALDDGASSTVRSLSWPTRLFNVCNVGYPIAVAANGDIILGGEFNGGLKLDDRPGATPTVQTSADFNRESFIVRYTSSGQFIWGKKFGNLSGDPSNCQLAVTLGLSLADNGDILLTGVFRGILEFSASVKVSQDAGFSSGFFAARYSGAGKALSVTDLGVNQSCSSSGSEILGLPGGYAAVTGIQDRFHDIRSFVNVYVP
jgi:hypothetical protein